MKAPLAMALWLAGCAFGAAAASAAAGDNGRSPRIGLDGPTTDACGGIGRVSSFDPGSDGSLPVRETPSPRGRQAGLLAPGTLVWLCDVEGDFQGIVYAEETYQDLGDCRVSRPIAQPEPYDGPCASGWVLAKRLQLVTE